MSQPKQKVAVLGGGLGAISAAFWLTSTPQLRAQYDVTVYQHGWRLGGKGASGRNPDVHERIEEHGVHMFLGFYENAFRTMRAAFAEWQRPSDHPWKSLDDAFKPQRLITLQEQIDGQWKTWNVVAPWLPGEPGREDGYGVDADIADHLENIFTWTDALLADAPAVATTMLAPIRLGLRHAVDQLRVPGFISKGLALLVRELQRMAALADRLLRSQLKRDDALRRVLYLVELFLAVVHAWLVDVLPHERIGKDAFSHLNGKELRALLVEHGCPRHVATWAPVKALYDLGFAYRGGDASRIENGAIAAGVGLKIMLRIPLAYKNAPLFRMVAGMGDTVFTPLYEVLVARGVHFKFFHRATRLHLDASGRRIDSITMDEQAAAKVPGRSYRPLVQVQGLGCWPSQPLWAQLADGTPHVDFENPSVTTSVATHTLQRGVDFDVVVCGVSKGALSPLCDELIAARPRWKAMMDHVPTTATQAFQVWVNKPTADLGFKAGMTIMTGWQEPFDSWGDMTETLPHEDWPHTGPSAPQSIHYFCSPMPEPGAGDVPLDLVRARAQQTLGAMAGQLWPGARSAGGGFDWNLLVDDAGGTGPDRLDAQYLRANTAGAERYVQSFPGTIERRLRADASVEGSDVDNLVLAGDWVITGLNAGSAEAAVEGGMLASRALCGEPRHIADCEV